MAKAYETEEAKKKAAKEKRQPEDVKKKPGFVEATIKTSINQVGKNLAALDAWVGQRELDAKKRGITYDTQDYDQFKNFMTQQDKDNRKAKGLPARNFIDYLLPFGEFSDSVKKGYNKSYKDQVKYNEILQNQKVKNLTEYDKQLTDVQKNLDPATKTAVNVTAGIVQNIPAIGFGLLTGGVGFALMQGVSSGFLEGYGNIKQAGGSELEANALGAGFGIVDYYTTKFGLSNILAMKPTTILKTVGKGLGTSLLEAGTDAAGGFAKGIPEAILVNKATNKLFFTGEDNVKDAQTVLTSAKERAIQEGIGGFFAGLPFKAGEVVLHMTKKSNILNKSVEYLREQGSDTADQLYFKEPDTNDLTEYVTKHGEINTGGDTGFNKFESTDPNIHGDTQLNAESFDNFNIKDIEAAANYYEVVNSNLKDINVEEKTTTPAEKKTSGILEITDDGNPHKPMKFTEADQTRVLEAIAKEITPGEKRKISKTAYSSLLGVLTPDQIITAAKQGADFTKANIDKADVLATQLESSLKQAIKRGDTADIAILSEAFVKAGSEAGTQLQAFGKVKWGNAEELTYNVEIQLAKLNAEQEKSLTKEQQKLSKEKIDKETKVTKKILNEGKKELEHSLIKDVEKFLTGLRPSKQGVKSQSKLNLKTLIKNYLDGGETALEKILPEILKYHFDTNDLTIIDKNALKNVEVEVSGIIEKGWKYQARISEEKFGKLLNDTNEKKKNDYFNNFKSLTNEASISHMDIFEATIDKTLPSFLKNILKDTNINLKDYTKHYQIEVDTVINDIIAKGDPYLQKYLNWSKSNKQDNSEVVFKALRKNFDRLNEQMLLQARGKVTKNVEKVVLKEVRKEITGLKGLSKETVQKIKEYNPRKFSEIFKYYSEGGKQDIATAKEKVINHFKEMGILRDDEINQISNLFDKLIHENIKKVRDATTEPLKNTNRFKEPLSEADILSKEKDFYNSGALFNDKTFKGMFERRIPKTIKDMLFLRDIDLKDYMFGKRIQAESLIEDLTAGYKDALKGLSTDDATTVTNRIQDVVDGMITDFEVVKRKEIEARDYKSTNSFMKSFRRLIEYGGMSENAVDNLVKHMNGKLVLTAKDREFVRLKQAQILHEDITDYEKKSILYDVRHLLKTKEYASKSVVQRSLKGAVTYTAANVLSGIQTAGVNIMSNVVRPTTYLLDMYIDAGVTKMFGDGGEGLRYAKIYTDSYFKSFAKLKDLFLNHELADTLKKDSLLKKEAGDSSVLDMIHQVAYNKKKFISLAINKYGHNPQDEVQDFINPLGSSLWGLDSTVSNVGKFSDIVGEVFNLPFDVLSVIDAPAKMLAFNAKVSAEVSKAINTAGEENEYIISNSQNELETLVHKYVDKSLDYELDENNPKDAVVMDIASKALQFADELTFQQQVFKPTDTGFLKSIYDASTSDFGKLAANLFVRTPINLVKFGAKEAAKPFAFAGYALDYLNPTKRLTMTKLDAAHALAKTISGALAYTAFASILSTCELEETYNKGDQGKTEEGFPIGYQLRIPGGQAIKLTFVEPYGKILLFMRDLSRVQTYFTNDEKGITEKVGHFVFTLLNDLGTGDMSKGWADALDAIEGLGEGSTEGATKWAQNKISATVPFKSFFSQFTRTPEKRQAVHDINVLEGIIDEFTKVFNPKSMSLKLSKYSGKVVMNPTTHFGMITDVKDFEDPVLKYVKYTGKDLPSMSRTPLESVDGKGMQLTPQEYYSLLEYMGNNFNVSEMIYKYMGETAFSNFDAKEQNNIYATAKNAVYDEIAHKWLLNNSQMLEKYFDFTRTSILDRPSGVKIDTTKESLKPTFNLFKN